MILALCGVLILLTPVPWWAVVIIRRALRRDPNGTALREQGQRFTLTGIAGVFVTVIAINYVLGVIGLPSLPRGAGIILLAAVLLLLYAPPAQFIVGFYRRRL